MQYLLTEFEYEGLKKHSKDIVDVKKKISDANNVLVTEFNALIKRSPSGFYTEMSGVETKEVNIKNFQHMMKVFFEKVREATQ